SADCPVHARLVPTGSDDGNRLSLPPSASARNGCPGRCTARRTRLCVRSLPSAPHVPVADADDLRCLPPRDLLRHGPQNHFLYFHRPLHRGLRVREHACHVLLPSPPEKRTDHVLSQPDISCANDRSGQATLRLLPCYVSFRWFLEMPSERQTVVRAEIVKINTENPEPSLIRYAAEQIHAGQVLGMPTDTFYGLAADPLNLRAVERVYEIKSRSRHKPLSLLIDSTDQAEDL